VSSSPSSIIVKWNLEWVVILHCSWTFSKYSIHWPNDWIWEIEYHISFNKLLRLSIHIHTLIARVWMAATTSSDPPRTRLPGNSGSYSQMALAFSMMAILVMWVITVTLTRFMTCLRHLNTMLSCTIDYPQELDLWELVLDGIPLQLSAGMLLLYCFAASIVIWCIVEYYCLQLQAELADLIEHNLTIIGCTFELPLFIIPTWSQRPTKYFPRFSPLCSSEIGWNPTTSACNFHLSSLTLIQWVVMPRNPPLVLSAVHPSLIVAIFPGAACNLGESQF